MTVYVVKSASHSDSDRVYGVFVSKVLADEFRLRALNYERQLGPCPDECVAVEEFEIDRPDSL